MSSKDYGLLCLVAGICLGALAGVEGMPAWGCFGATVVAGLILRRLAPKGRES